MSKASQLPRMAQVSRVAEVHGGVQAVAAAVEAERVFVFAQSASIRIVAAPHVLSVAAQPTSSLPSSSKMGGTPPVTCRAFRSFKSFKRATGSAGKDKAWHHIVEQTPTNAERFGPEALHNTEDIIAIETRIHDKISAYFSSKDARTAGMVVREWLRNQSYERQREFGLMILREFGVIP